MTSTATTESPAAAKDRGLRKSRAATVVSVKMAKTIVVETVSRVPHPRFGKIVKKTVKFHVHDEENKARVGDVVRIIETRPLSKLKRWRLLEITRVANPILAATSENA